MASSSQRFDSFVRCEVKDANHVKVFASHEVTVFQNFKVLTILRLLFKISTFTTQNSVLDDN